MLTVSPNGRRYGAHKSPTDHRDYGVARLLSRGSVAIPSEYDLSPYTGIVRDQGNEGSCTGQAGAGLSDFLLRKHNTNFAGDNIQFAPTTSASYLYAKSRIKDGTFPNDEGSYGRTVCKVLVESGICTDPEMPYIAGMYADVPSPEQDSEALTMRIGAYHAVNTVDDMKHVLASDYAVIIGFNVYESFETHTNATKLYAPKVDREQSLGGHEVLVIGYSDSKFGGAFKVRNSWGKDWADSGDFWFGYESMSDSRVLMDGWTAHYGHPWKPTSAVPHS